VPHLSLAPVSSPHISASPIWPQLVPLISWPVYSQFPSCPSLLPLPDPLLHCQPVLWPWVKVCILSDLMIRLSSLAERAILFTCSVERLCWRLRMTFIVLSCGFSPLSDFLCVRNKGLSEVRLIVVSHAFNPSEWRQKFGFTLRALLAHSVIQSQFTGVWCYLNAS